MKPVTQSLLKKFQDICPGNVSTDVSMAVKSNWRVGGCAAVFLTPSSLQQLMHIREFIAAQEIPSIIIGNTTNLLFSDEDIEAVIIQIGSSFSDIKVDGENITAQAGLWVPKLARMAMQVGLTDLEHTCGIPGTLGGLVVMNGGSQRKGIGENVTHVKTLDKLGHVKQYKNEDCNFSYRGSVFQKLDEVIVEVGLKLSRTEDKRARHAEMLSILRDRSRKFPRKQPNCGSVFVSNPAMYEKYGAPGRVIESCGLKGVKKGDAQVSETHANFILNNGSATARDILALINLIRNRVFDKTGYSMMVEPKFVTKQGAIKDI